jgi:hypothetical protein
MSRSDLHRPAEFDPEQYEWVGGYDNNPEWPTHDLLAFHLRALLAQSKTAAYGDGTQCDHCGAHIRYVGVFCHMPTGDHIAVGETCAEGRFSYDKATFDRLRKQAQLDREKQAIKAAWETFQIDHEADWEALHASENEFVIDVLRKGRQYGSLSDRQLEAIIKAVARDAAKAEEPEEITVPVPEGRQTITGTVLSVKLQDSYYGETWKMLVKVETPEGSFKVWGTVPQCFMLQANLRSDSAVEGGLAWMHRTHPMVTFTATVERSQKDESFGFFKRPAKAQILEGVA